MDNPSSGTHETYWTVEEVANLLRAPVPLVRKWLRDGKLDGFKVGHRWLIPAATLAALPGRRA